MRRFWMRLLLVGLLTSSVGVLSCVVQTVPAHRHKKKRARGHGKHKKHKKYKKHKRHKKHKKHKRNRRRY